MGFAAKGVGGTSAAVPRTLTHTCSCDGNLGRMATVKGGIQRLMCGGAGGPLRVVHLISTPAELGGGEKVVQALASRGAERGIEHLIVNPFERSSPSPWLHTDLGPKYRGRPGTLKSALTVRRWVRQEITAFQADLLHAHLFHAGILGALIGTPLPRILTHHHGPFYEHSNRRTMAVLDRLAGTRYQRVIAVSNWTAQALRERPGWRSGLVTTIRNGWSGRPVAGQTGYPTIVCTANFRPQKNHALLIDAFRRVKDAVPSAQLLLVGGGELEDALRERVANLGLSHSVEFAGSQRDPWPWLARGSVFALTSDYEPLGIAVLEGMAAGLPVVATSIGGIPELVTDGGTGFLVPTGDEVALAEALTRLLRNPSLGRVLGAAGQERASQMTDDRMAEAYFDLYESVIREQAER